MRMDDSLICWPNAADARQGRLHQQGAFSPLGPVGMRPTFQQFSQGYF